MAWPEKLPSGRYRGGYRDRQGNLCYLDETFTHPADARRQAILKEDEVRRRFAHKKRAGKIPYGDWVEIWFPKRKVEGATSKSDLARLRAHILPHWENRPLEDIDRDQVQSWVDSLAEVKATKPVKAGTGEARKGGQYRVETTKPLSESTRLKIFRLFSASMKAAVVEGRLHATPCIAIQTDRIDQVTDENFLTPEEFERLRTHAVDDLTEFLTEFGVGTGARWGELVAFHREKINTKQQRVVIQDAYDHGTGEIKPTKGRVRRGAPISAELAAKAQRWMDDHPAVPCRTKHRDGKACRGHLLLPNKSGTVLSYSHFRRDRWDPTVEAAGLQGVTPHDLRHTYASWLIQSGKVNIETLSKLLGHKDIKTTQRYAHLGESGWENIREVLDTSSENSDGSLLEVIKQRLAEDPQKWAKVFAALASDVPEGPTTPAPLLLHEQGKQDHLKIVYSSDNRSSTG